MSDLRDREIGDGLIDEVARQMTDAQPALDFRARVLARIADGHSPRPTWRAAWMLAPLAAAAVVIVAVFVARGVQPREPRPDRSSEQTVGAKPDTTVRLTPSVDAPPVKKPDTTYESRSQSASASKVRLSSSPQNGFGGTGKVDAAYATSEIDALAPPRLEVAALDVEALPTSSIAVSQLDVIAPITVAPLPTDDGRPFASDQRP